ncbi:MAG: hypothetical protein NZ484_01460 [Patescibacteria group bacterium]|nr:hypothetical protein [Patescibacteria group bacterium]MCX7589591.1 hypothetical protein [Patescibacteria group bacterium]MDW8279851.1 hypothetical protein [bacterium]
MLEFILTNILLISFGGILFLIAKAIPRIDGENLSNEKKGLLEKFIISDLPHKFDSLLIFYMGKFLRKLKVLILRLDNYLTLKLKSMNLNNNDRKIDFKDLSNSSNFASEDLENKN